MDKRLKDLEEILKKDIEHKETKLTDEQVEFIVRKIDQLADEGTLYDRLTSKTGTEREQKARLKLLEVLLDHAKTTRETRKGINRQN